MGENIQIESTLGEGSKFYFEIPIEIFSGDMKLNSQKDLDSSDEKLSLLDAHVLGI